MCLYGVNFATFPPAKQVAGFPSPTSPDRSRLIRTKRLPPERIRIRYNGKMKVGRRSAAAAGKGKDKPIPLPAGQSTVDQHGLTLIRFAATKSIQIRKCARVP